MHPTLKPEDLFNFSYYVGISFVEGFIQALNFCPVTQIRYEYFLIIMRINSKDIRKKSV